MSPRWWPFEGFSPAIAFDAPEVAQPNFSGWQVMKSLAAADRAGFPREVAHQVYYSLIGRDYEWDLMPLGLDQGLGAIVWSPLGWAG